MISPGERHAWNLLAKLDPEDVQTRGRAVFDRETSSYTVTSFGQEIRLSLADANLSAETSLGKYLVNDLGEWSRLSILSYLIHSKDAPFSGKLVKPGQLPGGEIFLKGAHVLPLSRITERFDNHANEFLAKGRELGGARMDCGDTSVQIFPFPRLPLTIITWSGDEEFPPNCSLLLDPSCIVDMPVDTIWSMAMIAIDMMLT